MHCSALLVCVFEVFFCTNLLLLLVASPMTSLSSESFESLPSSLYDVVIVGGGPAGYSAALYTARNALNHVLFEGTSAGGQLMKTTYVENYVGAGKINGFDLVMGMEIHDQKRFTTPDTDCVVGRSPFGLKKTSSSTFTTHDSSTTTASLHDKDAIDGNSTAESTELRPVVVGLRGHALQERACIRPYQVTRIESQVYPFIVHFENELLEPSSVRTRSIIMATGAVPRTLSFPSNEMRDSQSRFFNLLTCAVCDGRLPQFKNNPLAVIGGGDSAMEDALFLARTSKPVYIVHRSTTFRASPVMLARAREHPDIVFLTDCVVVDVGSQAETEETLKAHVCPDPQVSKEKKRLVKKPSLDFLMVKNVRTEEIKKLSVAGLFFAIGHSPCTDLLKDQVKLVGEGYFAITPNTDTETSIPGIHAAGDCQDFKYRQAICAAASGTQAALNVNRWLMLTNAP